MTSDTFTTLAERVEQASGEYDPDLCAAIHDVAQPGYIQPHRMTHPIPLTPVKRPWPKFRPTVKRPGDRIVTSVGITTEPGDE